MAGSATDKLKKCCAEAYGLYPNACNKSVLYVLEHVLEQCWPLLSANDLMPYLERGGWQNVTGQELKAQALADKGIVVIAGSVKAGAHGHVVVVYPGGMKQSGGYTVTIHGKPQLQHSHGQFPRCMSTSLGSWPGAKSLGDKTVWDAWGNDDAYKKVKYFAQPGS